LLPVICCVYGRGN